MVNIQTDVLFLNTAACEKPEFIHNPTPPSKTVPLTSAQGVKEI